MYFKTKSPGTSLSNNKTDLSDGLQDSHIQKTRIFAISNINTAVIPVLTSILLDQNLNLIAQLIVRKINRLFND